MWKAFETDLGVTPQMTPVLNIGTFPATLTSSQIVQLATLMQQVGELAPNANPDALAAALTTGT